MNSHRFSLLLGVFLLLLGAGCSPSPKTEQSPSEKSSSEKSSKERFSENTSPDAGANDAAPDKEPSCAPGEVGCRCLPTGVCAVGATCESGRCWPCNKGTAGCACDSGKCSGGLVCTEGVCRGCVGKERCSCFGNDTCEVGLRCVKSRTKPSKCVACKGEDKAGCHCKTDKDCGKAGLACVNKVCSDLKKAQREIPKDATCYQTCKTDFELPGGKIRTCVKLPNLKTGLATGCANGLECWRGSCVSPFSGATPPANDYPYCKTDSNCPEHQACISGQCYSNCKFDADCPSGLGCFLYVCRRRCTTTGGECSNDEVCRTFGADKGHCVPQSNDYTAIPPQTKRPGSFVLPFHSVQLSDVITSSQFMVSHKGSKFKTEYVLTKTNDDTGIKRTVNGKSQLDPLYWLGIEKCLVYSKTENKCEKFDGKPSLEPTVKFSLDPSKRSYFIFRIVNGDKKPAKVAAYAGQFSVSAAGMPTDSFTVNYVAGKGGQWAGRMVSFSNFDVHKLDYFLREKNNPGVLRTQLKNALLQQWLSFKNGGALYKTEQFKAMLASLRTETWNLKRTREKCKQLFTSGASDLLCYPYDSPGGSGFQKLTDSNKAASPPSGVTQSTVVLNLQEVKGAADTVVLEGRIDSSLTLQYPNNPEVRLEFDKSISPRATNKLYLKSLKAVVDMGGRHYVSSQGSCVNKDFRKGPTPWLLPGFVGRSVALSPNDPSVRQSYECRNYQFPLDTSASTLKPDERLKREFANGIINSSNPVPNGKKLRRTITLLDGALLDNKTLFVLYRESFLSFVTRKDKAGKTVAEDVVSYGYMLLEKTPKKFEGSGEFVGNPPAKQTECTTDSACSTGSECVSGVCQVKSRLTQVTCDPSLVERAAGFPIANSSSLERATSSQITTLMNGLIFGGGTSKVTVTSSSLGLSYKEPSDQTTYYIHAYCEDTRLFNKGYLDNGKACPPGSNVTYFALAGVNDTAIKYLSCQNQSDGCGAQFDLYQKRSDYRGPLSFQCTGSNQMFCDDPTDLRKGKIFLPPVKDKTGTYVSALGSLEMAVQQAFRYRLKFVSRTGKNLGFSPSICQASLSSKLPYCYDPAVIEGLEKRVGCLEYLFTNTTIRNKLSDTNKGTLKSALELAFAFRKVKGVTKRGFETLNAELKVMLGDNAYVNSVSSRFDLANSNLVGFDGTLFEADGVKLSGQLGYEMHSLYQSTQYYQLVLDRFFSQANLFRQSLESGVTQFVGVDSVTTYFRSVLQASTRKSRSFATIARKYHAIARADLARAVVSRAYTAAYLERSILSTLLSKMIAQTKSTEVDQLRAMVRQITLTYNASLNRLEEVYRELSSTTDVFGFTKDYIPFPAMDSFSATTNSTNAFQVSLQFAKEKLAIAQAKEQLAIQSKRSFDTNAASFQSEVSKIDNNYDSQLQEICGGISVTNTSGQVRVVPATPQNAMLSKATTNLGNPCGKVPGGRLYDALQELNKVRLRTDSLKKTMDSVKSQIEDEKKRIQTYCDNKFELQRITLAERDKQHNLQLELESTQRNIDRIQRIAQTSMQAAEMAKCLVLVGAAAGTDCPGAAIGAGLIVAAGGVQEGLVTAQEDKLAQKRKDILKSERLLEATQLQFECRPCKLDDSNCKKTGTAQIESNIKLKELAIQVMNLQYDILKAEVDLRIGLSAVQRLQQSARRLVSQQDENKQLAINVAAAQSDPNTRIMKNDSIITAERTFLEAMKEAARATRIYEYYTGQSYKRREELYLIRMISYGDFNLEAYLSALELAFRDFEEKNGKPDLRVLALSLKHDILKISRTKEDGKPKSTVEMTDEFRQKIVSRQFLNANGYSVFPFSVSLNKEVSLLSPITFNHKIVFVEANVEGAEINAKPRFYLVQKGQSKVRLKSGEIKYLDLPQRTAVLNAYIGSSKDPKFLGTYRNYRLRDRPIGNSEWELQINQVSEKTNQSIDLSQLTDVWIYIFYSDFTVD